MGGTWVTMWDTPASLTIVGSTKCFSGLTRSTAWVLGLKASLWKELSSGDWVSLCQPGCMPLEGRSVTAQPWDIITIGLPPFNADLHLTPTTYTLAKKLRPSLQNRRLNLFKLESTEYSSAER